jgi:hypothetical protein
MPQLDTGTYREQVTWLVLIFGGVYLVRRSEILPNLSRIVKLRGKKRERRRGGSVQEEGERKLVESGYGARRGSASGQSYGFLQETMDLQEIWMEDTGRRRSEVGQMGAVSRQTMERRVKDVAYHKYVSGKLSELKRPKGSEKGLRNGNKRPVRSRIHLTTPKKGK